MLKFSSKQKLIYDDQLFSNYLLICYRNSNIVIFRKKLEKWGLKLSTKVQKRSECKSFCYNVIYINPEKTPTKNYHIPSGEMYGIKITIGIRQTTQVTSKHSEMLLGKICLPLNILHYFLLPSWSCITLFFVSSNLCRTSWGMMGGATLR